MTMKLARFTLATVYWPETWNNVRRRGRSSRLDKPKYRVSGVDGYSARVCSKKDRQGNRT